jgi:hypothetical protein
MGAMEQFDALLDRLVLTPERNGKLRLMVDYFRATPDPHRGYALAALTNELNLRNVKPAPPAGGRASDHASVRAQAPTITGESQHASAATVASLMRSASVSMSTSAAVAMPNLSIAGSKERVTPANTA